MRELPHTMARYLDDLHPGDTFCSAYAPMSGEAIVAYAREFDPQPFHVDPAAAQASVFGMHVASGWHTASVTMRLMVDAMAHEIAGGLVGGTVEELTWPAPVRPGDRIRVEATVTDVRVSRSKPDRGVARLRVLTVREDDGAEVQRMRVSIIVPRDGTHGG